MAEHALQTHVDEFGGCHHLAAHMKVADPILHLGNEIDPTGLNITRTKNRRYYRIDERDGENVRPLAEIFIRG